MGRASYLSDNRNGLQELRRKRADGSAAEETLASANDWGGTTTTDVSSDGRHVIFSRNAVGSGAGVSTDIWALPLFGERKPFPLLQTRFGESSAAFSPDAQWFAYQSNEGGASQVYVQPFPPTGVKFQVSANGGSHPVWRPDGKELFFFSVDAMMAADVNVSRGSLDVGPPKRLFPVKIQGGSGVLGRQYAVTKDGRQFLMNAVQGASSRTNPLIVFTNWLASVKK